MEEYRKPVLLVNEDLAEGVYAASGDGTLKCESKYMNGVYQQGNYTSHSTIKDYFGCSGCAASWGRCAIDSVDISNKGDCAPDWELGTGGFRAHNASDIYRGSQDN